jgi:DNA polymerase gamma 1
LKHLDWTALPQQFTKPRFKKDGSYAKVRLKCDEIDLHKGGEPRPKKKKMAGKPLWFRDICTVDENGEETLQVTMRQDIAPTLYCMEYVPTVSKRNTSSLTSLAIES